MECSQHQFTTTTTTITVQIIMVEDLITGRTEILDNAVGEQLVQIQEDRTLISLIEEKHQDPIHQPNVLQEEVVEDGGNSL